MAVSYLNKVEHGAITMTDAYFGAVAIPACASNPQVLLAHRSDATAYSSVFVRTDQVPTTEVRVRRWGDSGSPSIVRFQAIDWNIGRQP